MGNSNTLLSSDLWPKDKPDVFGRFGALYDRVQGTEEVKGCVRKFQFMPANFHKSSKFILQTLPDF